MGRCPKWTNVRGSAQLAGFQEVKIKTRFYAGEFPLEAHLGTRRISRMHEHGSS